MPTAAPLRSQGNNQEVELDIEDMMDVTNYAGVDLKVCWGEASNMILDAPPLNNCLFSFLTCIARRIQYE